MQGEDNRSGIRVCVPHRAARLGSARLGSARLGSARLGVKPGNRYASRNSLGRCGSRAIHELSRAPPVPQERFPLRNDDAHPLTTHSNHPHKSTKSQKWNVSNTTTSQCGTFKSASHSRQSAVKQFRRRPRTNSLTTDSHQPPRINHKKRSRMCRTPPPLNARPFNPRHIRVNPR